MCVYIYVYIRRFRADLGFRLWWFATCGLELGLQLQGIEVLGFGRRLQDLGHWGNIEKY